MSLDPRYIQNTNISLEASCDLFQQLCVAIADPKYSQNTDIIFEASCDFFSCRSVLMSPDTKYSQNTDLIFRAVCDIFACWDSLGIQTDESGYKVRSG